MDVIPETAPPPPEVIPSEQETVPASHNQDKPRTLAVVTSGQNPSSSEPSTLVSVSRTPVQEVTASKEMTLQAELLESQLGKLYKSAGVLKTNIRVSTSVSDIYLQSDRLAHFSSIGMPNPSVAF